MNSGKVNLYIAVHNELCRAATLSETTRPYSVQSRLEAVQKLIMEELTAKPETKTDDNIPF